MTNILATTKTCTPSRPWLLLACSIFLAPLLPAHAQSSIAGELFSFPNGIVNDGTTAIGPPHKGFFASIPTTFTHDSFSGWADQALPSVSYHFNPGLSADMTLPYYLHLDTATPQSASHDNVIGDLVFAGHYASRRAGFDDTITGATSAAVGNKTLALSAGRMTGEVANHLDRQLGPLSADLDLGYGNSSELVRDASRKDYTSVGELGFVQTGASVKLQRAISVEAHAYDQIPLGNQTVYTSILRKNQDATVLFNPSAADDYGLSTSFNVPLTQKVGVQADYSYSVPLQDTVFGMRLILLLYKPIEKY